MEQSITDETPVSATQPLTPQQMFTTLLTDKYGPVMDMHELAEVLKVNKESIYAQIQRGAFTLPHMKHGRKYLFPTEQVAMQLASSM